MRSEAGRAATLAHLASRLDEVAPVLPVLRSIGLIALWVACAPVLGDLVAATVAEPGGARSLVVHGGLLYLVARLTGQLLRALGGIGAVSHASPSVGVARARDPRRKEELSRSLGHRARHEAAHALVASAMGAREVKTDIIVDEEHGRGGKCTYALPETLSPVDAAWRHLVIAMAGNEADLGGGVHSRGSWSDLQQALVAAAAVISTGLCPPGIRCPLTTDDLLAAARGRVQQIFGEHADSFEALTQRLVSHPREVVHVADLREERGQSVLRDDELIGVVPTTSSARTKTQQEGVPL